MENQKEQLISLYDYEAIIFDLGGVLLNISYERTAKKFEELFGEENKHIYSKKSQTKLFDLLETGKISEDEFVKKLITLSEKSITKDKVISAWNAMLLDMPKERIELLQDIGQKKRIFLLSNTNAIHKEAFDKGLREEHGIENLSKFFERAYYSHLIGMRKPNKEVFEFVIKENHLVPEKTLFIDDSPQHVEGARLAGLNAYHLEVEKESILDLV